MQITSTNWQDIEKVVDFCKKENISFETEKIKDVDLDPIKTNPMWDSASLYHKRIAYARYVGLTRWGEVIKRYGGDVKKADSAFEDHVENKSLDPLIHHLEQVLNEIN